MERLTYKQRIAQLSEWYAKAYGSSVNGFEAHCNLSNAYCQNLRKRKDPIAQPAIEKIADALPEVNKVWLAYGEGEMLEKDAKGQKEARVQGSPYYKVDFIGGFDIVENNQQVTPDGYIDMEPFNGDDFVWCNITGDSMSPIIRSGSRICLKKIYDFDNVIYGEIYALVIGNTKTGENLRTVKWVAKSDEEGCLRLVPENKDIKYGVYQDVPISNILHIFKVVFAGSLL